MSPRSVLFALALLMPSTAVAAEVCYQLSPDGKVWSKTPELLCVTQIKDAKHALTLKTGLPMPGQQQIVATFALDLIQRAKCLDECNRDVFAVANPSNSVFNLIAVKFVGALDAKTRNQTGTVSVGKTRFHFRRVPTTSPVPPRAKKTR